MTATPTGNNTVTYELPAGYTTGGTITANGAAAYAAGHAAALPKNVTRIATHLSQASTATVPSGCVAVVVLKPRSIDTIRINGSVVNPIILSLDGAHDMPSGHESSLCTVLNPSAGSLACISADGSSRTFEAWAVTC